MANYAEEQQHELEALEAIYITEFKLIEEGRCFEILVSSEERDDDFKLSVYMNFQYVENYPDEGPIIELRSGEGLENNKLTDLNDLLKEKIEENLGMVMVFTLVSETQEFLNETVEEIKEEQENEKERKRREAEKAELAKVTGTPVTFENFTAWKIKFDEEMTESVQNEINNKLTGRQLFEQKTLLGTLDEAFLGDDVQVDESLFQELDDLDLDEELDGKHG